MKFTLTFLAIALISFSFIKKNVEITEGNIIGMWEGAYGDNNKIEKLIIELKPENKMELYKHEGNIKHKITGTYLLKGDMTIFFSYKNENGISQVLMYGNLNKTRNFVDGIWQTDRYAKGSFYLQKQSAGPINRRNQPNLRN